MAKQQNKENQAKVIALHDDENVVDEKQTVLQQAAEAEKKGDLNLAEKLYLQQMKLKTFNAFVYSRLMIIYRKQKKYKEELEIINKGLQYFKEHDAENAAKKKSSASIKKISNSLNKSLGLVDKKGNAVYEPEPIPTWKKRKTTVEKKLKKQ